MTPTLEAQARALADEWADIPADAERAILAALQAAHAEGARKSKGETNRTARLAAWEAGYEAGKAEGARQVLLEAADVVEAIERDPGLSGIADMLRARAEEGRTP